MYVLFTYLVDTNLKNEVDVLAVLHEQVKLDNMPVAKGGVDLNLREHLVGKSRA